MPLPLAGRSLLPIALAIVVTAATGPLHAQSGVEVSASDGRWTVLTMAPDGSWGAATETMSSRAIANAVAECQHRYRAEIGCGGHIFEMQRGWFLGVRCGNENIIASGWDLAEAERAARRREIELRTVYRRDMPPCRRVVTIDPRGTIATPEHPPK